MSCSSLRWSDDCLPDLTKRKHLPPWAACNYCNNNNNKKRQLPAEFSFNLFVSVLLSVPGFRLIPTPSVSHFNFFFPFIVSHTFLKSRAWHHRLPLPYTNGSADKSCIQIKNACKTISTLTCTLIFHRYSVDDSIPNLIRARKQHNLVARLLRIEQCQY